MTTGTHTRTVEITLSHTYAEDAEFETIDCPGTPDADGDCGECGRSVEQISEDGDLL